MTVMLGRRLVTLVLVTGITSTAQPFVSTAQPPALPDPPPYLPGNVDPAPGSFDYPYNIIVVGPPATTDARGVRINTNVDPGQQLSGLPGSQLGNTAQAPGSLTNSSAQYGIGVGNSHPLPPNPGISISAGHGNGVPLEHPAGLPPSSITNPESSAPDSDPTVPALALEDPEGTPVPAN